MTTELIKTSQKLVLNRTTIISVLLCEKVSRKRPFPRTSMKREHRLSQLLKSSSQFSVSHKTRRRIHGWFRFFQKRTVGWLPIKHEDRGRKNSISSIVADYKRPFDTQQDGDQFFVLAKNMNSKLCGVDFEKALFGKMKVEQPKNFLFKLNEW